MQAAGPGKSEPILTPGSWRAVEADTPAARTVRGGGVEFPCPFDRVRADRFYWDHGASLRLQPGMALEVDFTVHRPEAFRALHLYLESGPGWYVATIRPQRPGRSRMTISPSQCATEGQPAGWSRITRVRFSAWRGADLDAPVALHSLSVIHPVVTVVKGTRSVPASERRTGAEAADRFCEWFNTMRVPHALVDEEDVDRGALRNSKIAVLPYNTTLPDSTRREIFQLLDRGGRLLVCYSADAELAKRMGFTLGSWVRAKRPLQWSAFSFKGFPEWNGPERVLQQSGNLLPPRPLSPQARVMAWWEDERGRRSEHAAWVESQHGAWMSHILLSDDAATKPHLAAALAARYAPELWPEIARALMESAGRVDSFRSTEEAIRSIERGMPSGPAGEEAGRALQRAREDQQRMKSAGGRKDYGAVMRYARALRADLTEAYARIQRSVPGEFRGVWDHDGTGWYAGDWKRSATELRASGVTAVFANLAWGGIAHYPSAVLPGSFTLQSNGDQADQFVRAVRAQGIEAHAWIVCAGLGEAPPAYVERLRKEGRMAEGPDRKPTLWLNLAHPANQNLIVSVVRELATHHELDGIHLDYIRYPGSSYDCSDWTRQAFTAARGQPVAQWPRDVLSGGPLAREFQEWRAQQITALVRRVRSELKKTRPSARLSVAVYADYPDCVSTVGQDWSAWLRDGLVDFVCPMTYTENLARFTSLTTQHMKLNGSKDRVYPGIGVTANESRLMPDQAIEQILAARRAGAHGFVLFSMNAELRDATLPVLRMGPTRPE